MTLAQLRYTIAIAKAGSMNEAAKRPLYFSAKSFHGDPGTGGGAQGLRSSEEQTVESP